MLDISVIILTFNEELHLKRCIERVKEIANDIYVIDSFSTDKTVEIAQLHGATVFQHQWDNNYAKQFNWALTNIPIKTKWVLRLDADEYLTTDLIEEIINKLPKVNENITGIAFPLKRIFLNKEIKRGILKLQLLRLFQFGKASCEQRWMDEHIHVKEGEVIVFEHPFVDHNLNNIGWWTRKHDGYSIREAVDLLNVEYNLLQDQGEIGNMESDTAVRRARKLKYAKLPLFWRPFMLFLYRYIIKLGFIDGKEAFLWHFLQGWWYRTLVDAKVYEIKKACGNDRDKIKDYIRSNYNLQL